MPDVEHLLRPSRRDHERLVLVFNRAYRHKSPRSFADRGGIPRKSISRRDLFFGLPPKIDPVFPRASKHTANLGGQAVLRRKPDRNFGRKLLLN